MAALEATDLVHDFGSGARRRRVLSVPWLAVEPGEFVTIVGPSGSGKTTLLSIVGTLLRPSRGHVHVGEHPVDWRRPRRLASLRRHHIGFVFQRDHLIDALTATENVAAALDIAGTPRGRTRPRARALLHRVGLDDVAGLRAAVLSGGERQRVAVSRAIANDPAVVIADEPTASLDSHNVARVAELLASVAADGRAVVVATHDPRVAMFATRTLELHDGILVPADTSRLAPMPLARATPCSADGEAVPDAGLGEDAPGPLRIVLDLLP